jgi:rubrerythrin
MAPSLTRREALGGAVAAAVLASCGGGDPPPSTGPAPGSGGALLGSLLALERAAIAAYGACGEQLSGRALENVRAIRAQEREHARRLEQLIAGLGGEPAPGRSDEEYAREFPRLESAGDALRFAEDLKERELRAYLEALTELPSLELREEASRICVDEGSHLGAIRVVRGLPAAQGPFVTGAL